MHEEFRTVTLGKPKGGRMDSDQYLVDVLMSDAGRGGQGVVFIAWP
jgi:hypothetical protein